MENSVLKQIMGLKNKSIKELRDMYEKIYGKNPSIDTKNQLIRDIAYRLQELKYGFMSDKHNKKMEGFVKEAAKGKKFCKTRYYKPTAGTVICKEYRDQMYKVETTSDGFMCNGLLYKSLSSLATKITGNKTNGLLFFGVAKK